MTSPTADPRVGYPRQEAVTRRFRLGAPRSFRIAPDGGRLAFIRSSGGRDPVGSLWVAEEDGTGGLVERLVVDAHALIRGGADLPAAERARRERMRETTTGITAYSTSSDLTRAAFIVNGVPYVVDLTDPRAQAVEVAHPGPVVDAQMSPDGARVAFVHDRAVYVADSQGAGDAAATLLCAPDTDTQSWGLADFVAAEELDRHRGLWWLPAGEALLVELVDEADVEVRWIADPSRPEREPVPHRYPMAGTPNATVRLSLVALDGVRTEVEWDHDAYPYLATVEIDATTVVSVLSRDQRRQLVLELPVEGGHARVVRERITSPWLTMHPGVPSRAPGGSLLEIIVNEAADCHQLVADGRPVTPAGLDVMGLAYAGDDHVIVTGTRDPMEAHVLRFDWQGSCVDLTSGPTVSSVSAGPGGTVIATADGVHTGIRYEARLSSGSGMIRSLAEEPVINPRVTFHRVTSAELAAAVLWPSRHHQGSGLLPVVMAPYGGPHHNRVVHAARSFAPDQWLADQGFAVIVVDGRGTPGRGPAWEFAISPDMAAVVLDDQVAALQGLGAIYPDLDLTRVGITGWSFGGYLAALAVLDRPDVFRAAVAGAPVSDMRLYDTAYSERYLGLPQDEPDAYDAASLLPRAHKLERPLLLIHGLADDNVLVANTLQLSGALLAAGRAHSVLPLSGVTHMTPQEIVAENLLHLQVQFLREHLA